MNLRPYSASPKGKNPRRPSQHLFCQCSRRKGSKYENGGEMIPASRQEKKSFAFRVSSFGLERNTPSYRKFAGFHDLLKSLQIFAHLLIRGTVEDFGHEIGELTQSVFDGEFDFCS